MQSELEKLETTLAKEVPEYRVHLYSDFIIRCDCNIHVSRSMLAMQFGYFSKYFEENPRATELKLQEKSGNLIQMFKNITYIGLNFTQNINIHDDWYMLLLYKKYSLRKTIFMKVICSLVAQFYLPTTVFQAYNVPETLLKKHDNSHVQFYTWQLIRLQQLANCTVLATEAKEAHRKLLQLLVDTNLYDAIALSVLYGGGKLVL